MQPRYAYSQAKRGSGGTLVFLIPPGGFAPLSTRESGYREPRCTMSGSLRARIDDPSTRESGLVQQTATVQ